MSEMLVGNMRKGIDWDDTDYSDGASFRGYMGLLRCAAAWVCC